MTTGVYRFTFDKDIALTDAEATLHLAMIAAEGLFGNAIVPEWTSAGGAGRSLKPAGRRQRRGGGGRICSPR